MTSSPPGRSRPRRFDWSNLRLRVLSAAVLAPLAVLAVWMGGLPFLLLVWGAIGLLALEWATMSAPETPIRTAAVMAIMLLVAAVAVKAGYFKSAWLAVAVGAAVVWVVAMIWRRDDGPMHEAFGVLYLGVPMVALLWLRSGAQGRDWTLMLLAATWSSDIGAYAGGTLIGGPKLWPRISPKKTWSGFAVGIAAAMVAAELVAMAMPHQGGLAISWAWAAGLVVGLATMAGDLCESMLKRSFGVKDSGSLIPGHGGLLDRVDGLMFAALAMAAVRFALRFGVAF
ncbi:phosphatidate cytidylyltransferase [Caulobacter sp. S45]|uniref:phosphatidate cytidylyltransferase n=1 Tax=Caulobacter sp. S45 TaxID=1641861 RepID=UPI001577553F|nr:phosphatidate cytidylyltransferase [Caulobacter sp. S45]